MLGKLKTLFSTTSSSNEIDSENLQPECPLYVVGDLHGCFSLLESTVDKIEQHVKENGFEDCKVILLGDYVDRGPQSAQVLEKIFQMQAQNPGNFICLMGNHEKMMIDFIDDPAGRGHRWLNFGGVETLQSYGITAPDPKSNVEDLTEASMDLEEAMPEGLQEWIRNLPVSFKSGNIVCVHAGLDPERRFENQSERILLWGHSAFMKTAREDDLWVAHGHTIIKHPSCNDSRISLDTGAYKTGRLTTGVITQGHCQFLTA